MAKKDKKKSGQPNVPDAVPKTAQPLPPMVSKCGWKWIGTGVGVLIIGYGILTQTDPQGQNWASQVSPFLIIGGYVLIGLGLYFKDPQNR